MCIQQFIDANLSEGRYLFSTLRIICFSILSCVMEEKKDNDELLELTRDQIKQYIKDDQDSVSVFCRQRSFSREGL